MCIARARRGAFGLGHADLPVVFRTTGQPVLIGESMGTSSYVLAGAAGNETLSYASACHGAGRCMSRHHATRTRDGRQVFEALARRGIVIRSPSHRGVADEAQGAYKDVDAVVRPGLARRVAHLEPVVWIKG